MQQRGSPEARGLPTNPGVPLYAQSQALREGAASVAGLPPLPATRSPPPPASPRPDWPARMGLAGCLERVALAEEALAEVRRALAACAGQWDVSWPPGVACAGTGIGSSAGGPPTCGNHPAGACSQGGGGGPAPSPVRVGANTGEPAAVQQSSFPPLGRRHVTPQKPPAVRQKGIAEHKEGNPSALYDQVLITLQEEEEQMTRVTSKEALLPTALVSYRGLRWWMATPTRNQPAVEHRRLIVFTKVWGKVHMPTLHPEHGWLLVWNLLGFVLLIYVSFAIPVFAVFDGAAAIMSNDAFFLFSCAVDLYFIVDMLLQFFTAYTDANGTLVTQPGPIARNYACGWFLPDLVSSIPWDLIVMSLQSSNALVLARTLRFGRIAWLTRLMKASHFQDKMDLFMETMPSCTLTLSVLRLLMLLFAVTHWGACAWYSVGTCCGDEESTWVGKYLPADAGVPTQYMYSLYFTLTTMTTVGYGDITPSTVPEIGLVLVLLLVASMVFAALLSSLTDLMGRTFADQRLMGDRRRILSGYLEWRKIPQDLREGIRRHRLLVWEAHTEHQSIEKELIAELPPTLRQDLCYEIYGPLLMSAPFLAWMRHYTVCVKELASKVTSVFMTEGDDICRLGEANDKIFLMTYGVARLTLNENLHVHSRKFKNGANVDFTSVSMLFRQASKKSRKEASERVSMWCEASAYRSAVDEMLVRDAAADRAAVVIQRRWRKSYSGMMWAMSDWRKRSRRMTFHSLCSQKVVAPAFFGESCLWVPFEEWATKDPPAFQYTVKCESLQVELISISRAAMQGIIVRFSPWLRDRLEHFRQAVLQGHNGPASDDGRSSACQHFAGAAHGAAAGPSTGAASVATAGGPLREPLLGR